MSDETIDEYLKEKTKTKTTFSFTALKRAYPKDKDKIKNYKFVGLIDNINDETPDVVRAHVY